MSLTQPELPFDWTHGERQKEREKPALPYFDSPECDNERLLNLQREYREKGDRGALSKMYTLGYRIALRYIGAKARKNRRVAELSRSEKEEKAHNAITYMIERYLKVPGFAVRESFTAYLYLRVQHELFYRRKIDGLITFTGLDPKGAANDKSGEKVVRACHGGACGGRADVLARHDSRALERERDKNTQLPRNFPRGEQKGGAAG